MTLSPRELKLVRPIIGIENRTAQEVFDIMCDRIRSRPQPSAAEGKGGISIEDVIKDPVLVHVNMLSGTIAKPDIRSMLHLYGADAIAQFDRGASTPPPALGEPAGRLVDELNGLEESARMVATRDIRTIESRDAKAIADLYAELRTASAS